MLFESYIIICICSIDEPTMMWTWPPPILHVNATILFSFDVRFLNTFLKTVLYCAGFEDKTFNLCINMSEITTFYIGPRTTIHVLGSFWLFLQYLYNWVVCLQISVSLKRVLYAIQLPMFLWSLWNMANVWKKIQNSSKHFIVWNTPKVCFCPPSRRMPRSGGHGNALRPSVRPSVTLSRYRDNSNNIQRRGTKFGE